MNETIENAIEVIRGDRAFFEFDSGIGQNFVVEFAFFVSTVIILGWIIRASETRRWLQIERTALSQLSNLAGALSNKLDSLHRHLDNNISPKAAIETLEQVTAQVNAAENDLQKWVGEYRIILYLAAPYSKQFSRIKYLINSFQFEIENLKDEIQSSTLDTYDVGDEVADYEIQEFLSSIRKFERIFFSLFRTLWLLSMGKPASKKDMRNPDKAIYDELADNKPSVELI